MTSQRPQRLYLSSSDKKITGLCGGIAEYLEIDSSLVRLAWIIVTALTGILPGVVAYIVASIVVTKRPVEHGGAQDVPIK